MPDRRTELERFQFAAAECEILAGLAKDDKHRELYERLEEHYRGMIFSLAERAPAGLPRVRIRW